MEYQYLIEALSTTSNVVLVDKAFIVAVTEPAPTIRMVEVFEG